MHWKSAIGCIVNNHAIPTSNGTRDSSNASSDSAASVAVSRRDARASQLHRSRPTDKGPGGLSRYSNRRHRRFAARHARDAQRATLHGFEEPGRRSVDGVARCGGRAGRRHGAILRPVSVRRTLIDSAPTSSACSPNSWPPRRIRSTPGGSGNASRAASTAFRWRRAEGPPPAHPARAFSTPPGPHPEPEDRRITQLRLLATWLDTEPDVPEERKTFLPGQHPKGKRLR